LLSEPRFNNDLHMSPQQEEEFQRETKCHICRLPFLGGIHPMWDANARMKKEAQQRKKQYGTTIHMHVKKGTFDHDLTEDSLDSFQDIEYLDADAERDADSDRDEEVEEHPSTKVRDHDHRNAKHNYRGAAHAGCNLQYRTGWNCGSPVNRDPNERFPLFFTTFVGMIQCLSFAI
jgi:hypothetical protein